MSEGRHRFLEGHGLLLTVMATVLITIGGLVEIVPLIAVKTNIPPIPSVKPYSALELEGRDLYVREGCYNCHSQMVRPFRAETLRYPGGYGKPGEFVYDHPFQWGSKRTGPDLLRVGGKYPDSWHYLHMENPQETSEGSIMPPYPWLITRQLSTKHTRRKLEAMKTLGVPYSDFEIDNAVADLEEQAQGIVERLAEANIEVKPDREIIALIAYLQRLGTDARE